MEIEAYNPYNSLTLSQRLLNRRLHNTSNRLQNSLRYRSNVDRVLHRRQNRFANLNRFGEQFIVNFPINENNINVFGSIGNIDSSFLSLREFVEIDAAIKIQRWYKRYMYNKKYIKKSLSFVDR